MTQSCVRIRFVTAACIPGFYCEDGASTPVPCPAGTSAGAFGQSSQSQCVPVPVDFWAPLGSSEPERCPPSGFFCPGALADSLYGGARPIVYDQGGSTNKLNASVVVKEITL